MINLDTVKIDNDKDYLIKFLYIGVPCYERVTSNQLRSLKMHGIVKNGIFGKIIKDENILSIEII